jgi:HAD superfamily hydrolase (TIGR01549 family)
LAKRKTLQNPRSLNSLSTVSVSKQKNLDLPSILFDLDGTLIDSVYEHVTAWSRALRSDGIVLPNWKIHRHIGMSGGSFVRELLREVSHKKRRPNIEKLEERHDGEFRKMRLEKLPGAQELLNHLEKLGVRWAIATTSGKQQTKRLLKGFNIPKDVPIVNGDDVENTKPSPDIFVKAAEDLGVPIDDCIVVGDSIWDVLAAGRKSALGVGLLSGGYSQEELERAGAFRVYADPADLLVHIEDLGIPGR